MLYNLFFSTQTGSGSFNIFGLKKEKLDIVIDAYKQGQEYFTISGKKYFIKKLLSFQIFTHEVDIDPKLMMEKAERLGILKKSWLNNHVPIKGLEKLGKNVTDEIIGDIEYGHEKATEVAEAEIYEHFVHLSRIEELSGINNPNFDFSRLIQLCNEINDNYTRENFLSVAMLGRSIINHVPPLFGFDTFNQVANNYGNKSFKGVMNHLNNTMRGIADSYLHDTMRKKENIPNSNQVNFSQDLDVLLSEVVRIN